MSTPEPKGRGDFFAIDRRAWILAYDLGINAMTAYLVVSRGSSRDQRSSAWSVNAVENYTGMSRPRAQVAIDALIQGGLLQVLVKSTRPRYRIVPAHEIPTCQDKAEAADWIWLPNALVDGASDETPPVELLRQTQNSVLLRLFIELYHAQALASDGGINWTIFSARFSREIVGRHGSYVVYGFCETGQVGLSFAAPFLHPGMSREPSAGPKGGHIDKLMMKGFNSAFEALRHLGLVYFVEHLVEAPTKMADIIHPYGLTNGEALERRLARAAHQAGLAMLTMAERQAAEQAGLHLAPILAHITEAQMVGVARLRYMPRTGATSEWFARMPDWQKQIDRYSKMI